MTNLTVEQALEKLADIVWWFHGFSAARPPSIDEGPGEHRELRDHAQQLRTWLVSLARRRQRRLAVGDAECVLITLAELESMRDGLEPLRDGDLEHNTRIVEQRECGWEIARRITAEYAEEERSANNPFVPF